MWRRTAASASTSAATLRGIKSGSPPCAIHLVALAALAGSLRWPGIQVTVKKAVGVVAMVSVMGVQRSWQALGSMG